jgi:uncharacterized protein YndB with AHSA1/START domain
MAALITVEATINAPISKVWTYWTSPQHITKWNSASDDWHSPRAENDLKPGGKFNIRMEAKNGSMGFDFEGTYDKVIPHKLISYIMGDGRTCTVGFADQGNTVNITETFEAESQNPEEMQRSGWQAILNNFKKYCENN